MSADPVRRSPLPIPSTPVVAVVVAAVIVVAGVPTGSGPAAGASTGACADHSGVTVVIDFQQLGGGVEVRCAPGPVADGFDALRRAGISYTTTIRFPGFLCRIDGRPAGDPCVDTPPATAYWSYWLAERGGQWCYASLGAAARRPPPGTVEAWSFSLDRSGAAAAAPRIPVPARLPGATPRLPDRDCDRRTGPTTNPPTTSPNPPAPPPSTIPPVAIPEPARGGPATPTPGSGPGAAGTGPDGPVGTDPATAGPTDPTPDEDTEVAGATMDDVSSTTSTAPVATAERPGTPEGAASAADSASPGSASSANTTDAAGSIVATVAAVALMLLLGGGAAAISRRRRIDAT